MLWWLYNMISEHIYEVYLRTIWYKLGNFNTLYVYLDYFSSIRLRIFCNMKVYTAIWDYTTIRDSRVHCIYLLVPTYIPTLKSQSKQEPKLLIPSWYKKCCAGYVWILKGENLIYTTNKNAIYNLVCTDVLSTPYL